MIVHTTRWSLSRGNRVVPSPWQATRNPQTVTDTDRDQGPSVAYPHRLLVEHLLAGRVSRLLVVLDRHPPRAYRRRHSMSVMVIFRRVWAMQPSRSWNPRMVSSTERMDNPVHSARSA
jgi:hypothetical protein